jgi:hypothetical protein
MNPRWGPTPWWTDWLIVGRKVTLTLIFYFYIWDQNVFYFPSDILKHQKHSEFLVGNKIQSASLNDMEGGRMLRRMVASPHMPLALLMMPLLTRNSKVWHVQSTHADTTDTVTPCLDTPALGEAYRCWLAAVETKHPNIGRTGTTCADIIRHLTVKNLYNCVILVFLSIFYDASEDGRFNVGRNM